MSDNTVGTGSNDQNKNAESQQDGESTTNISDGSSELDESTKEQQDIILGRMDRISSRLGAEVEKFKTLKVISDKGRLEIAQEVSSHITRIVGDIDSIIEGESESEYTGILESKKESLLSMKKEMDEHIQENAPEDKPSGTGAGGDNRLYRSARNKTTGLTRKF